MYIDPMFFFCEFLDWVVNSLPGYVLPCFPASGLAATSALPYFCPCITLVGVLVGFLVSILTPVNMAPMGT